MKTLTEWQLGKYKLCLAIEIQKDKEGKPVSEGNQYYRLIRRFNKNGYLVLEERFRADGRRFLQNGVAQVVYSYDKNGNIISRKHFGEIGVKQKLIPIFDKDGVYEYRYTYQEYFNYDGKPILNECLYYRKEKGILLEPYDCALKIEHFGIDGQPIEDKRNVYRTNIYYTGAYQEEAARHYYSFDNKILSVEGRNETKDPFGNGTLSARYEIKEGALVLDWWSGKSESKYDERNNKTLEAYYRTSEGKEVLVSKEEWKYDERYNEPTLWAKYERKGGNLVLVSKGENKYDDRNYKTTLRANYELITGKEVLVEKSESKYDDKNNNTQNTYYEIKEGKEVLVSKSEYKYDERNNKTLEAYYQTSEGKEVLVRKYEWKYDERNNKTFFAYYKGDTENLEEKTTADYRLEPYMAVATKYEPQIKEIEARLKKIEETKDPKDNSEKNSLSQKLEDLKKEFEAKKKKYTLTEEKFGKNEKLESASYKLLFFNPRGPAEKRLMRVDLDRFYRPVKVGFEVETPCLTPN